MPKAKDTEYRDNTATAEKTEHQDRTALRALPGSGQADRGTRRVGSGRPATAGVVSRAHTLERLRITQGPG